MNTQTKLKNIIFDFDYTLADSSRGVESCINYALEKLGFSSISYERACKTIGLSLQETYATLTGIPASQGEKFRSLFIEQADKVMAESTVLFDDTLKTIQTLRSTGFTLGIVSTKFRYRIETILRREKMEDEFTVIVGGEDVKNHKPHPESLLLALDKLGANPSDTIYVGDSVVDANTAQNGGISFIAVLSGVAPKEDFEEFYPRAILEGVGKLPNWLQHKNH